MSETNDNDTQPTPAEELTTLKARADMLGVKYHPAIGLENLREKVNAKIAETPPANDEAKQETVNEAPVAKAAPVAETEAQLRFRKKREANELLRIRVSCMNPAKTEWEGELFTAGNSLVGSFSKFVLFNAEDGYHVPRIIYNQLIDRHCQIFVASKDARGNSIRVGKIIREFAIEVLPALTVEELEELARRQAASKSIG